MAMEVGPVASPKEIDSMALGSNEVDGCIDEIRSLLLHATHEELSNAGTENSRFQVLFSFWSTRMHLCCMSS